MSISAVVLGVAFAIAASPVPTPPVAGARATECAMEDPGGGTLSPTFDGCLNGTINNNGEFICLDSSGGGGGSTSGGGSNTCPSSDYTRVPRCPVGCNLLRQQNGKCYYGGDALASTCDDGEHSHNL